MGVATHKHSNNCQQMYFEPTKTFYQVQKLRKCKVVFRHIKPIKFLWERKFVLSLYSTFNY